MVISRPLHYLIVICASIMLFIWGLPNTIALRNAMMLLGSAGALYFLLKYKPFVLDWKALPLVLLYILLLWVLAHYFFFARDPQLQFIELKSLWLRVFAGMLIATAMGVLIRKSDRVNGLFIAAFFGMSISVVAVYCFNSINLGYLLSPTEFLNQFLFDKNKVGTAFFSVVDLAVGCASLTYIFYNDSVKHNIVKSVATLTLMGLSIAASIMANSKNGVGIGLIVLALFMTCIFAGLFFGKRHKKLPFGLLLIFATLVLSCTAILVHKNRASPGWDALYADIQTAVDIDKYQAWRGPLASHGESIPQNSLGIVVAANTYERFAWIAAGSRELIKHPLGYGTINHPAFPRWLKVDGIAIDSQGATHSGWLDLGLSFGWPAIFLVFLSVVSTLLIGMRSTNKAFFIYLAMWISLAVFSAGFLEEITFKHTFEALLFLITFSAACIISLNGKYEDEIRQ